MVLWRVKAAGRLFVRKSAEFACYWASAGDEPVSLTAEAAGAFFVNSLTHSGAGASFQFFAAFHLAKIVLVIISNHNNISQLSRFRQISAGRRDLSELQFGRSLAASQRRLISSRRQRENCAKSQPEGPRKPGFTAQPPNEQTPENALLRA